MDKKSLLIGIVFLAGGAFCLSEMFTNGLKSFTLTGLILFTLIGIAFIKKSRSPR